MGPLPRSARLAAWGSAWLAGAGSLDDLLGVVRGGDDPGQVVGLPGEPGPVGLAVACGALRTAGARGLRLALPAPGDPLGLPGPPALTEAALAAGEAVVAVGCGLALVPEVTTCGPAGDVGRAVTWRVWPAAERPVDVPSLAEAERELTDAVRTAAADLADLADLDVSGGPASTATSPATALAGFRAPREPVLPPGAGGRAERVAATGLRLLALVRLAPPAPALRPVERAARRALVAAVGSALEPSRE